MTTKQRTACIVVITFHCDPRELTHASHRSSCWEGALVSSTKESVLDSPLSFTGEAGYRHSLWADEAEQFILSI
jgi:hypothetical protein